MRKTGRPRGRKNVNQGKEEKLALVKRSLAGEPLMSLERATGIYNAQIHKWTKQYLAGREAAPVNKRKPGNPLAKYECRKELTPPEQLEYKITLSERERLKKKRKIGKLVKTLHTSRTMASDIILPVI